MNNYTKGYQYEKQVKNYIINHLHKEAYLWSETPETILIESGIIGTHNDLRLKNYIDNNKKRPTYCDKNEFVKKIGLWVNTQTSNYKNQKMSKNSIEEWENFINDDKYKKYFISNEEFWDIKLNQLMNYIDKNNKRPSQTDKDNQIKILGLWTSIQIKNYKNQKQIMSDVNVRIKWENFMNNNKYKIYFMTNKKNEFKFLSN